jgi:heme/copper-type cytochrome/quinol oxidase subunit 3
MTRTPTTRWRVSPVAWVPITLAIAAESVSNALRAYGLGTHLDRFTVTIQGQPVSIAGAVLVLAAVAVSLSQARAAWVALTPSGPARQRIVAGIAAALLLSISITAMASHILEAQRAKVADEGGARGRYDRARSAYDKAAGELASLGAPRPVAVIQAEVQTTRIDMAVWRRSNQCADISRDDTKAACEPILKLYKERGAAARKAELEPEVARLRGELAKLERPEEASASESAVSGIWAWIMGLGVVFVATFGTVIFARVEAVKPATANDNGTGASRPASPPPPPAKPHPVITALRQAGRPLSNDELAEAMGVTKGEASKRWREVSPQLSVTREGRELRIALAA